MENTFLSICLLTIVLFAFACNAFSQKPLSVSIEKQVLKLMTYNLKFASSTYQPSWEIRRVMQVDMIRKYAPDIIATQEGLKEQIDYLMTELPEYIVIGEGRKGGDDDEHMAIFFKRDKFRLREMHSFQLSKTPELIGSGPEVNPRIVTWARLAFINPTKREKKPAIRKTTEVIGITTVSFMCLIPIFLMARKRLPMLPELVPQN